MFDGKYFDWNQKRVKGIVDYYGYKFFYGKKIADLGCGHADISGVLYRLGSDITAVDARQEHLKVVSKKFPGVKTVKGNLDGPWPFHGQNFDMILDLGLLCHLANFETHLKTVCASTTYLVLETAVCDSDDPQKCIQIPEGKEVYDLSYNGMGCRPSVAAIERVLTECRMSFKRLDNPKFNSNEYTYDWAIKNTGGTDIHKRKIWFCTKNPPGVVLPEAGGQPVVVMQPPNSALTFTDGIPTALVNSGQAYLVTGKIPTNTNQAPVIYTPKDSIEKPLSTPNVQVMKNSQEFAIISPDHHQYNQTYITPGIILPTTSSSKSWIRKIISLFPNLKLSMRAVTMQEFPKSIGEPNVIMCSLDNLVPYQRVWVDEWFSDQLTKSHVEILSKCQTIVTPSIINAQEIRKYIPNANIVRVEKTWPVLLTQKSDDKHFLYFEKDERATTLLVNAWNPHWGKLKIVGTRHTLHDPIEVIPDTADYSTIMTALAGAKAVIDISNNLCYMSGILNMAHELSIPVISNNQACINWNSSTLILQDNTRYPTEEKIDSSINKFLNSGFVADPQFNLAHNNNVNASLLKILGV